MSGFPTALSAFHDFAAKTLKVPATSVKVSPSDEASFKLPHLAYLRIGNLYQLEANSADGSVRGWSSPDGTVVTPSQNLGLLFREAGVWTTAPSLKPRELAERIAWALGREYEVRVGGEGKLPEPALRLTKEGAGSLKFHLSHRTPGPGGAGGGPGQIFDCTVQLSGEHKANLKMLEMRQ